MKTLLKKMKNRRGETLIESLVAILAFTLSSLVMYSMVTAASDVNRKASEADKDFREQLVVVEQAQGAGTSSKITLNLTKSPADTRTKNLGTVDVAVYKSDDLYAYYVIP